MAQTQEGLKLDEVEDCLLFFADLLHENPVVWNKTDNRYMNNNLKGKAFKGGETFIYRNRVFR